MTAGDARQQVTTLLLQWCDALVRLQIDRPDDGRLDGALLCPACGTVHGRCHEAVYPLLFAAHVTGNNDYLTAAKRLFAWGRNMQCDDGAFRNDFQSSWKGVTVFAAIALHDALALHGDLLTATEKNEWEARLSGMGKWLYHNLSVQTPAYLNYYAANACAMALLGTYFSNDDYLVVAERLAAHCMTHVTDNGLIFGEGRPNDALSPKGCRPIDLGGYNVEETLPCLTRYAAIAGDREMLDACRSLWRSHLLWMLPDGAWDDSTGTRSFKWTYWGSRTADGCQAALFSLGKDDPVFAEAAWRNLELYRRCTFDGLLAGGPDYRQNGEPACVHHTFCHAKVLAAALDDGIPAFDRVSLPSDQPDALEYYHELDTWRAALGKWRMDVCGYDFNYSGTHHVSGGSISLLWHEDAGPLIAVGMMDNTLREPHNQQLSVHPGTMRPGCPRIEATNGNGLYGQQYCLSAALSSEKAPDGPVILVDTWLCDQDGNRMPVDGACALEYRLTEDSLTIHGRVAAGLANRACFVLPLIGDRAKVETTVGCLSGLPEKMFSISPGFLGREYRIRPDQAGRFQIRITV